MTKLFRILVRHFEVLSLGHLQVGLQRVDLRLVRLLKKPESFRLLGDLFGLRLEVLLVLLLRFSELGILAFEGVCAFDGMGCIKRVSLELDGRCVGLVLARKPAGQ